MSIFKKVFYKVIFVKKECKHVFFHAQVNNLYGQSLQSYLPINSFEWDSEHDLASLKDIVLRSSETDSFGYMLEVDIVIHPVSIISIINFPVRLKKQR